MFVPLLRWGHFTRLYIAHYSTLTMLTVVLLVAGDFQISLGRSGGVPFCYGFVRLEMRAVAWQKVSVSRALEQAPGRPLGRRLDDLFLFLLFFFHVFSALLFEFVKCCFYVVCF